MCQDRLLLHLHNDHSYDSEELNDCTDNTMMPQVHHRKHHLILHSLDLVHNMHYHDNRHLVNEGKCAVLGIRMLEFYVDKKL